MSKFNVIEYHGIYHKFGVDLVRRFRVLHKVPKCWEEVTGCVTQHGTYESGSTTIYQSKTTKKYYMVRYFDGCFSQMYAEVSGVDWRTLKSEIEGLWGSTEQMRHEMWERCQYGEMTYLEKNVRTQMIRNRAKDLLLRLVA